MTYAVWTSRSQMESAIVGSPFRSCQPDERGGALAAVLEDLEYVLLLDARERGQAPVVDHQQLGLGQPGERARVGTVAAGDVELVEEPRGAHAVGRVPGAAR